MFSRPAALAAALTAALAVAAPAATQAPEAERTTARIVERVELRQEDGRTLIRLAADGALEATSVIRAGELLRVLLPPVDLNGRGGVWEAGTGEVVSVGLHGGTGEGAELQLVLWPRVSCDLLRVESGLEVECAGPPLAAPASTPEPEPPSPPVPQPPGSPAPEAASSAPPEPASAPASEPAPPAADPGADPPGEGESGDDGLQPPPPPPGAEDAAERVTLDFRDADLRDVLRVLSEVSGLDFVLQPGVAGRVSLRLTETPWDQALDVILRTHQLGHVLEGGVLRVGRLPDLMAERRELQMHEEERALAGDLLTARHRLAYVRPEEVRETLEARLSDRGLLVADPRTGTVLIRDVESRIHEIEDLIEALDIPVPGVEIESRIVLASRTLSQRLGIQWGGGLVDRDTGVGFPESVIVGGDAIGSDTGSFTTPGSGGVRPPAAESGPRPGYGVDLPISELPTGVLGLALGALGGLAHLDFALAAAERDGEVRVLSAPRIVAQNARPATIKQGVTFPVQVVANNTVTVQFQDAVLELTVTPQVSPRGSVLLDLEVSNDSLDFGQSVGGIPSIVTQRATTRVRVADGETTVIGGVFAQRESENRGRVPALHRIPLLGHLFRSREEVRRQDELLIFLTPRIR